jgi:hypothetical protein
LLDASDIRARIAVEEVATDVYGHSGGPAISLATAVIAPLPPTVTSVERSGPTAVLTLGCAGPAGQACAGSVTVTAHEHTRAGSVLAVTAAGKRGTTHKKPQPGTKTVEVTVARGSFSVPAGTSSKLTLTLNGPGKALLASFYSLPTTLSFSDNARGADTLTFFYPFAAPAPNGSWQGWTWKDKPCSFCYTTVDLLRIPQMVSGARVQLSCQGSGCPGGRLFRPRSRSLNLTPLFTGSQLGPGTKIELVVTATNTIGRVVAYTTRPGATPAETVRCLPPGYRKPVACR